MDDDLHRPPRSDRRVKRWKQYTTIITDGIVTTQQVDPKKHKEYKGDASW